MRYAKERAPRTTAAKLNTHVLRKIFAQVSKTRRIPDRSGKDRRCMSVSQSQASY